MYRAVTWAALARGIELTNAAALADLAQSMEVKFDGEQVFVDGRDVTSEIRHPNVTRHVVSIADAVAVRMHLVELQRQLANTGNFVCEGRDQGTVAFPDAFCKIYLTASSRYRAQRRVEQLESVGAFVDYDQIIREQNLRDQQDRDRPVGRLQKASDAIEFNTDDKSIEEVVSELLAIVRAKLKRNSVP